MVHALKLRPGNAARPTRAQLRRANIISWEGRSSRRLPAARKIGPSARSPMARTWRGAHARRPVTSGLVTCRRQIADVHPKCGRELCALPMPATPSCSRTQRGSSEPSRPLWAENRTSSGVQIRRAANRLTVVTTQNMAFCAVRSHQTLTRCAAHSRRSGRVKYPSGRLQGDAVLCARFS